MDPAPHHQLPPALWAVPYVGSRFPGSSAVADFPGLEKGANCQLYAYEVLRHFGLTPPALRSSDLWADTRATSRVPVARPLDLVLFNATDDAYGAHVGVCVDEGRVLHLCAEVGRPAVWEMREFSARERYRVVIGIKRVIGGTRGIAD
ncbi:hydrolase [Streptomyces sp. NPDC059070]|uniref:hydrolase n=1 Tax=unclassified Streptomyces TaxID=2593676 RepID=UPI0034E2D6DA